MLHPDSVRRDLFYVIVAFLTASILVGAGVIGFIRAVRMDASARPALAAIPAATPSSTPVPPAVAPTPAPPAVVPATKSSAGPQMAALTAALPPGSVSVAARNLTTGATLTFGSSGSQTAASVIKVDILETLLLQQQASGGGLTDDEDTEATAMIEDSNDGAAGELWKDIGGGSALTAANRQLGVPCTVPGPEPHWGLTTSCAQGQVQLLYQLESHSSPLDQSSRAYILDLMENVDRSQAWGVPVIADSGTDFAVKNGWLNPDGDNDWAVNSEGIVTYHGQTLLIAVMTQNNGSVYSGVALIQELAPLVARSVAS